MYVCVGQAYSRPPNSLLLVGAKTYCLLFPEQALAQHHICIGILPP